MNVSSIAIEELNKVLKQAENPQAGIRIFTQQGCCGPGIQMVHADQASQGDKVISIENINFFIEDKAEKMLEGVTLDYGDNGFRLEGLKSGGGCC